ncbi:hypothetical protein ACT7DB_17290 [Bacillus cereus]
MPLEKELKDIRKEEQTWKTDHTEENDKWKEKVDASDVKDDIKDLFSHDKDGDWTKEKKKY